MDVLFQLFLPFVLCPPAALLPAVLFGGWFYWDFRRSGAHWSIRPLVLLMAAGLWLAYGGWEFYVSQAFPSASVPIRVDVLFIAPVLGIVSSAAVAAGLIGRKRQPLA
ncbi:MAG: hypothetical protein JW818_16805 [Pirellulales bacterium]|nr:hypothetical protein [Pirellulales bacterium]